MGLAPPMPCSDTSASKDLSLCARYVPPPPRRPRRPPAPTPVDAFTPSGWLMGGGPGGCVSRMGGRATKHAWVSQASEGGWGHWREGARAWDEAWIESKT